MSTLDIKTYFERYTEGPNMESLVITWLNDSACTVKFESVEFARKAYKE
jgi:hypothetical protein